MSTTPPTEPTATDAQPTEVYPPAVGGYGDAYAAQGYAPRPDAASAPTGPDTRSKGIAWTALVLAIVGTLLSLGGFVPVVWVGLVSVLIGGLVLLAAFIFAIVGLVGRRNGGTPLSVTALVLSVFGAVVGGFALVVSLVFIGLSAAGSSSAVPIPGIEVGQDATESDDLDSTADESAFFAEVRPRIEQIMGGIDASLTPEIVEQAFPDEVLIMIGQALLVTGEAGIDSFVGQTLAAADDTVGAEQLRAVYEAIYEAAQAHLQ